MSDPRILLLDIETAPNKAYVWGLWDQNIQHNQIEESSYILCWAAKWLGEKKLHFASVQKSRPKAMLKGIHTLLNDADIVVHYYGSKFDIPVLNREFVKMGYLPPSPYRQLDLKVVCARVFKFESNKLDYVSGALSIGNKVKHAGFELWIKCMNNDRDAWAKMEEYNRGDVTLLEKLYHRLQPWIPQHPNISALSDVTCCPRCGSTRFQKRGVSAALTRRYVRYQCQACGGWFRGTKPTAVSGTERMTNISGS